MTPLPDPRLLRQGPCWYSSTPAALFWNPGADGSTSCSTAQSCICVGEGISPPPPMSPTPYYLQTETSCNAIGMGIITDQDECLTAGTFARARPRVLPIPSGPSRSLTLLDSESSHDPRVRSLATHCRPDLRCLA